MSIEWLKVNDEINSNPEKKDIKEISEQDIQKQKEQITSIENKEKESEEKELSLLERLLESWLDTIEDYKESIDNKINEVKDEISEKAEELSEEVTKVIDEVKLKTKNVIEKIVFGDTESVPNNEKEELIANAKLANLAYDDLKIWEEIEWWYTVLDKTEKNDSWFDAMVVRGPDGTKTIAIRWTEGTHLNDLMADWELIINNLPLEQVISMIKFVDKNTSGWEKVNISWHSLWWALTQAITAMIPERINTSYTYNAPWVKNLKLNTENISTRTDLSPEEKNRIITLARRFEENKWLESVWNKVKNVEWNTWVNLIAWLNDDIWKSYYIPLSIDHSIEKLASAMKDTDMRKEKKIA